jgi:predicted dehydrogenase
MDASGCDVYAERPINRPAPTSATWAVPDNLVELLQTSSDRGLFFYSGTQRRLEYPYRFIRQVLEGKGPAGFGRLRSIRCTLYSGRRHEANEWRRDVSRAGGGIVLDEGYHLLDMAVWLAQNQESSVVGLTAEKLQGWVRFRENELGPCSGIETSAFGHIELPGSIELLFDLSYMTPKGSVYERLELRDENGARLRLTRDHPLRSATPGRVLYQDAKGQVVRNGFAYTELDENDFQFVQPGPDGAPSDDRCKSNDTRPLRQCLANVRSGRFDVHESPQPLKNDCDARFLVTTQELIKGIYRLAQR